MPEIQWKGERSFRREAPQQWRAHLGPVSLIVWRAVSAGWFLGTTPSLFPNRHLATESVDEAKLMAVRAVREWLETALAALPASPEQAEGSPE